MSQPVHSDGQIRVLTTRNLSVLAFPRGRELPKPFGTNQQAVPGVGAFRHTYYLSRNMPQLTEGTTPSVLIRFPQFFHQSVPDHALSYTLRIWFGWTNIHDAPGVNLGVESMRFYYANQQLRGAPSPPGGWHKQAPSG